MENEKKIKKVYFTLTGTKYHYGMDFLEKGMKLYLEKEPDNKYDKEAIMVKKEGLGLPTTTDTNILFTSSKSKLD